MMIMFGTQFFKRALLVVAAFSLVASMGCELRQRMYDQPKYEPLEKSNLEVFPDGRSARELIEGTVSRGNLRLDEHLYKGTVNGEAATEFPFPVTEEVLNRGHERFDIYCSVCHGKAGYGNGMVVQRGYKKPSSYHIDRLRESPPGYFYHVINNGFGVMAGYADQIPVEDRWAIVAYVKTLQHSQFTAEGDLSGAEKQAMNGTEHVSEAATHHD